MKTKENYFFPDRAVLIYYIDYYGDERKFFVLHFPYKKKNKYSVAKAYLDYCRIYYKKILRIETDVYSGKKKGMRKVTINF